MSKIKGKGNTVKIYYMISEFRKKEVEEIRKSQKKEKKQVCLNPDSMIGKEILYQTALLHQILEEERQQTKLLNELLKK